jgi:HSP20 family molecular chaperone IbpA
MALVRWDPWGELTNTQREMDRMLSRVGGRPPRAAGETAGRPVAWMPCIDVREKDGDLFVEAEVPGLKPEASTSR